MGETTSAGTVSYGKAEAGRNLTNVVEKARGGLAGADDGDELGVQRKKWSGLCFGTVPARVALRRSRGSRSGAPGVVLGEGDGG